VLFALVYLMLRHVLRLIAGSSNERLSTEVELVVLRHQLKVLKRQVGRPPLRRRDRVFMAAISRVLPRARWSSFLVSPQTLLRWHRELVRRKWTFRRRSTGGRPPIAEEIAELILRMGKENPRWGCIRIRGELAKLGVRVSATKIRTLLRANGMGRLPGGTVRRGAGSSGRRPRRSWRSTSSPWKRRGFARCMCCSRSTWATKNPDSAWVTQHARNLAMGERLEGIRFLIRDRDSKFSGPFDEVFRSEGVRIVKTPIRAPRANAFAERWVRTVRAECLDWMLMLGRRHLEHVLRVYADHYNEARPHRGLDLRTPEPRPDRAPWRTRRPEIRTHGVLGGLIREYELAA